MNKAEKTTAIAELKNTFESTTSFYLADSSGLTVEEINKFRRLCFSKGVKIKVIKNTLAKKALTSLEADYSGVIEALSGPTTLMFAESASLPAKLIKQFRESKGKPSLKAAYIDRDVYLGDDQLDMLRALKSKEELIGDVIFLLQSPIKQVLGSLQSGGNTISGLLKTLEERGN